ncbi:MAG: family 78 glycoside hydrolase catalytic domain [Arachidicoccus sp.]|nr:family 78 glycoside hydrolase catalytic domain [Arachidicoccus sp.]
MNKTTRSIIFIIFILFTRKNYAQISVDNLLTENLTNPIGIDQKIPRFSWQINTSERNILQNAYEIIVKQNNRVVWNSGKVYSDSSLFVTYKGMPIEADKKYTWKVRIWDNKLKSTNWSNEAYFQTGLLSYTNWKAQWIQPAERSVGDRSVPLFRKKFSISKKIKQATMFITSHGMYEAFINGNRVGDAWLTPGWTSYNKRIQYQAYDVTSLLNKGSNVVGSMLGSGWYHSVLAWNYKGDIYGKDYSLLLQINITYQDGSKDYIITDKSWKTNTSEIEYSEIYNGEITDIRRRKKGWNISAYDDSDWSKVKDTSYPKDILVATINESVAQHEIFRPIKIFKTSSGDQVIDFGQNLVGWVRFKVSGGNSGDTVILSHAEVLDKQGNFYTDNLRTAKAEDIYILNGKSVEETFHPHFTWHGFRYVKIKGYPGEIKRENFEAVALYSNMPSTGTFVTSDTLINQLQHNIQWGQKGNFLDVPTDCPQRDERLGWTGDAQVFFRTASFNRNVYNFFNKWLGDIAADQKPNGLVPDVIPDVLGGNGGSSGWADAAAIIPWNMYITYGDRNILAKQYASMKSLVSYMTASSKNYLWNNGRNFGDWLFFSPFDDKDGQSAVTDKYLIAQCFFAHSTQLLVNTAAVLGKKEDVKFYSDLLLKIKTAFLNEYMTPTGRLVSGTQTAYVLALEFDMLPDSLRLQAANRLVENIKKYRNHITTGFLGTPYIMDVLTKFGRTDVAYQLLFQKTYPSWLYPITKGATTIWERWDGVKPNGTFENPEMNSFNHYAYGAVGDWMYRTIGGIDTYSDAPGYKHAQIKPDVKGHFNSADTRLMTGYGLIKSAWKKSADSLCLNIQIPANTIADLYIPISNKTKEKDIVENNNLLSQDKTIKIIGKENEYFEIQVGSGNYQFKLLY